MKFSAVLLLAAALVGDVVAKGNSTKDATPGKMLDKSCSNLQKWTAEIALANNQTKLDELMSKNVSAEKIQKIKDKAANSTAKLNTLKGNNTLVSMCDEAKPVEKACGKMAKVMKLAELATNTTKLDKIMQKDNLTDAQVTKLKEKASNATSELKTLMSNSSLTSMCDAFTSAVKSEGKTMAAIKAMSNNTEKSTNSSSKSGAAVLSFSVLSTTLLVGVSMIFLA